MIDIGSMAAVASSLKAAGDITKAAIGLRDAQALQAKIIELQGVILSAQSSALSAQASQFALLERVRELEKEIASLKAWESEKAHYELREISPGGFAYALKPQAQTGEPPHWLCAACYQRSHKAILQDSGRTPKNDESIYKCPDCKSTILVHWSQHPGKDQPASKAPPSEPCPLCEQPMKRTKVEPDPQFAFAGLQQHTLECSCGHTEKRQFDPNGRTTGSGAARSRW